MKNKHLNIGRFIAMILFLCILFTLLFSVSFIIFHTDHNCTGEGCVVCAQLKTCADIIKKLNICLYTFPFAIFAYTALSSYTFLSVNPDKKHYTLVRLKVRLDI